MTAVCAVGMQYMVSGAAARCLNCSYSTAPVMNPQPPAHQLTGAPCHQRAGGHGAPAHQTSGRTSAAASTVDSAVAQTRSNAAWYMLCRLHQCTLRLQHLSRMQLRNLIKIYIPVFMYQHDTESAHIHAVPTSFAISSFFCSTYLGSILIA